MMMSESGKVPIPSPRMWSWNQTQPMGQWLYLNLLPSLIVKRQGEEVTSSEAVVEENPVNQVVD